MKLIVIYSIIVLAILTSNSTNAKHVSKNHNKALKGAYLGQKPPALNAQKFAPNVVSIEHRDGSAFFSPDMNEFFFTRRDNTTGKWSLISYKNDNGQWHQASVEPRIGRPNVSPDGRIMHLGKQYRERTSTGWSEEKRLGSPYDEIRIMRLTSSLKGTYFLDEGTREGDGVLRYAPIINGKRQAPEPLSKAVNTGKWNAHPYIAPDESYLLWDGERETGFGGNDIYVSFKQSDGSWGEAINLGDKVNSDSEESAPYVTPDGKYLFFNSKHNDNVDLYWIDAQIIKSLQPKP